MNLGDVASGVGGCGRVVFGCGCALILLVLTAIFFYGAVASCLGTPPG